jgi:filamin
LNLISIVINESHSGRVVPHTTTQKSPDKKQYQISFTPNFARQHTISISYDGKLVSTHYVDVCNLNKIRVSSITDGIVGNPSVFSVDTHGAGEGHLEVTITDGQRTLPAQLKSTQARKFDIAFTPEMSGKHSIIIAFNSIPIEGSPFTINIQEPPINDSEDENDDHEFIIGGQLQGTKVGEVAWLICETSLTDIYEDCDLYVIGRFL